MKSELIKNGMDLAQTVYVRLTDAVNAASTGGDYDTIWEQAMQYQTELLSVINRLKYQTARAKNEAQGNTFS